MSQKYLNIAAGKKSRDVRIEMFKKRNVYSVGVLRELSSVKKPFADKEYNFNLAEEITQGLRESIIEDTPEKYSNSEVRGDYDDYMEDVETTMT